MLLNHTLGIMLCIILAAIILVVSETGADPIVCSVHDQDSLLICVTMFREEASGGVIEISEDVALKETLNLDQLVGVTFLGVDSSPGLRQDSPPVLISGGVSIPLESCSDVPILLCGDLGSVNGEARHLFLDGVRYSRPQASGDIVSLFSAETTSVTNSSYTIDSTSVNDDIINTIGSWAENVEVVYTGQGSPWSESRCAIESVEVGETTLTVNMKTPCFATLQNKPCGQSTSTPVSIENTGLADLLNSDEGTFWVDAEKGKVYVNAQSSNDVLIAIVPDLVTLVSGAGVQDVSFKNVRFEYATYNQATTPEGFIEQQSGALVYAPSSECDETTWYPMQSNIVFTDSSGVTFSECEFRSLGAGGLQFHGGGQGHVVSDCLFEDISGTAIQLGEYDTANVTDKSKQIFDNKIVDNVVRNVANEYHGTCGIQVGYSASTVISHNTLYDLPYSGISIGWGWGRSDPSYAANNVVNANIIHDFKLLLGDGGGIYALSAQANSTIDGNWLYNMGKGAGGGAYYPDQSSAYWTISNNVFSNSSFCSDDCEWLHVWQDSIHDINVIHSYVDTTTYENNGIDVSMDNTVVVKDGDKWPQEAKNIMDSAGVRQ